MPHIPRQSDANHQAAVDAREEFHSGFKRSKRGNLWRHYQGLTLVVFSRDDGYFAWSISDSDGPRFSQGAYESEEEALEAIADELEIET